MRGTKTLRIEYYAALRDASGVREEALQTAATTAAELYAEVARRHGLPLDRSSLGVAVNHAMAGWTAEIHDGDTVAFLPPFAGG